MICSDAPARAAQTANLYLIEDLDDASKTGQWLAPEQIAGRSVSDVIQMMSGYKAQFLRTLLQSLAVPSSVEDGVLFGPFYEGSPDTAIYNSRFRPFRSPVPILFVRHTVISEWKFFLDSDDWLNRWAHRYGKSAVRALAEELPRMPWRARGTTATVAP
jgi:hypothetical protein